MNLVRMVSEWSLAERVSWALLHTFWIGAILGLFVYLLIRIGRERLTVHHRYYIFLVLQAALFGIFTGLIIIPQERQVVVWNSQSQDQAFTANGAEQYEIPADTPPIMGVRSGMEKGFYKPEVEIINGVNYSQIGWASGLIFIVYFIGLAFHVVRNMIGLAQVHRLRSEAREEIPEKVIQLLGDSLRKMKMGRAVELGLSRSTNTPMVIGFFKPMILFPVSCITKLDPIQVEALMAHELTHIKNNDYLTNLIQVTVETVLFFHPVVWWAGREARQYREFICDEVVVQNIGGVQLDYAKALSELASHDERKLSLAASGGHLIGRIRAILGTSSTPEINPIDFKSWRIFSLATVIILTGFIGLNFIKGQNDNTMYEKGESVRAYNLQGLFGRWKELPFRISENEENAVKKCVKIAGKAWHFVNSESQFYKEESRDELLGILAENPELFYAEHLLGSWYEKKGHYDEAADYYKKALEHAPQVLICRYVDEQGDPIEGAEVQRFEIECNRVIEGYLDPSLDLLYPNLKTDSEGCIYLPTYKTVHRTTMRSHLDEWDTTYPKMGWFKSKSKYGLLPEVVCSKKGESVTKSEVGTTGMRLENGTKLRLVGVQFSHEPDVWRDADGRITSKVPSRWNSEAKGKAISLLFDVWDTNGLIDFGLRAYDEGGKKLEKLPSVFNGGGITSQSQGNQTQVFLTFGLRMMVATDQSEVFNSYLKGLKLIAKTGSGDFDALTTIQPGESKSIQGGTIELDKVRGIERAREMKIGPFGLFGSRRYEGLTLVDARFEYDPNFEIAIGATLKNGDRILPSSSTFGSGNYSHRERRFYQHLKLDTSDVSQYEVLKRPVVENQLLDFEKLASKFLILERE